MREALFSLLGDMRGAAVLDLFAGTGALGIEALSRGAQRALFVERDRAALTVLRENLRQLQIGEQEARVRPSDALAALRTARARGETYDLVFVDPPYERARELGEVLAETLPALLEPGARVVLEADRRTPAELALPVVAQRRYGDTTITIYSHDTRSQ